MTMQWALREGYNPGREAWLSNKFGWIPVGLPKGDALKAAITAFRGGHGTVGVPRLKCLLTAPAFSKGGRVLFDDGLFEMDAGEVVFTALGPLRGHVRVGNDVERAKAILMDFLGVFPFADDTSRAVGLALFFTQIARAAFPLSPAFAIDAPEYGSGKTFLAVVFALLAGMGINVIACGSDSGSDEELVKRFETALMVGAAGMILLDDVPNGRLPNFSSLRTFLSATVPEIKIRRFGKNDEQVPVRIDRATLVVTGNAIEVTKDMVRRVVRSYLNPEEAFEGYGWSLEKARAVREALHGRGTRGAGGKVGVAFRALDEPGAGADPRACRRVRIPQEPLSLQ
ncbi:hypothetical protein [Rhodoblastus sp.]|uniref:hypothetical protein n=1 Tax=Rhodoblastus sp. TaxID=1962975 RepID=UPI003F9B6C8E